MSNLAVRLITAAVAVPVVVAGLVYLPPAATLAMAMLVTVVGAWEILGLFGHAGRTASRLAGTALAGATVAVVYVLGDDPRLLVAGLVGLLVASLALGLAAAGDVERAGRRVAGLALVVFYPSLLLALLALMRRDVEGGARWVIVALLVAFLSDTGAYFAGRFLGRHALAPAISPKKTIEGSVGGIAAAVASCLAASATFVPELPLVDAAVLGALGSVVGQVGDLVMSLLKRSSDTKDTGSFFPGHGGVMDRLDGAVFVTALFYVYLFVWGGPS
jgi:phosphatidate cytidylyltransferase